MIEKECSKCNKVVLIPEDLEESQEIICNECRCEEDLELLTYLENQPFDINELI